MNLEIKQIITQNNPRQYGNILQSWSNQGIKTIVDEYGALVGCTTLIESLYCYSNNISPAKCKCGANALFNTFSKGYRKTCGNACPVRYSSQAMAHKKFWKDNPEKKKEMVKNRIKYYLRTYGAEPNE